MRRYAGILLDVDGTLVDSNDAHAHAWVETLAGFDHEVDFARVRTLIGVGGDRLIETLTGEPRDSKRSKQIGERRSKVFCERWLPQIRALDGARELILRLRSEGYQYAIASAAKADELVPLLELADIADLCERRTTSSDVPASKPDPAAIEAALGCLSVDRSRVVMFGDTPYDIEACRGADVDIIAFTTGGWSHDALAGAVGIYRGPAGLLAGWADSPLAS
ncbi:MAG: HAD family hydrolase [Deltaproteobacteria bacterium]|nr:HAD family hydrolase [Deltaproteobacteria bacterium]